jgi:hypothetical protein
VRRGGTVHPHREYHHPIKQPQALQALFAVGFAVVFLCRQRRIENDLAVGQIDAVLAEIFPTFRFVPGVLHPKPRNF